MSKPTMEELFDTLPDIPEGFREQCMDRCCEPTPIYYKRKGRYADCTCGKCGKPFLREEKPERFVKTHCSVCGEQGLYEWKRCSKEKIEFFTVVLVQRTSDNNIVLRHFHCMNRFKLGLKQHFTMTETHRYFMRMGDFWKFNMSWSELLGQVWQTRGVGTTYADYLYPGSEEEIEKSNLKYFKQGEYDFITEMKAYARNPAIEMFRKVGLQRLANEIVYNEGRSKYINRRGKSMKAQLRLKDKSRINYLIKNNGGISLLRCLQLEEKNGITLPEYRRELIRRIYDDCWNGERDLNYMLRFMSITKLINRVSKYKEEDDRGIKNIYSTFSRYVDYIHMREELGYDMKNEVFLFPKNLKEKHDEMVVEKNRAADELYAQKQEAVYGKIRDRYDDLEQRYGFNKDGLMIRPAESATEIIMEGRILHHCVGRMGYMEKHNKGTSFILLLRKEACPTVPYYTIEIKGKDIVQWYGIHDSKPDKEVVGPWLNDYVSHLGGEQVVYG